MNRAIFLDRDGTIIKDKNYLGDPAGVDLLSNAGEALYLLQNAGFKLIVITNQSGIARGIFTKEDLYRVHKKLRYLLLSRYEVKIDGIYYSPDLPGESETRKPSPNLALRACKKFEITPWSSFVIGNSQEDIQMGKNLGAVTVLLDKNGLDISKSKPNYVCKDLYSAAQTLLRRFQVEQEFAPKFVEK